MIKTNQPHTNMTTLPELNDSQVFPEVLEELFQHYDDLCTAAAYTEQMDGSGEMGDAIWDFSTDMTSKALELEAVYNLDLSVVAEWILTTDTGVPYDESDAEIVEEYAASLTN